MPDRALRSLLLSALATAGCSGSAPPRDQALIVLDTDAPLVGQIAQHPELSLDAAIDTVRIDLVDDDNHVVVFREITAPDPRDWPVSFGGVPGDRPLRFRIRAFRGQLAERGTVNGESALEPPPSVTINRLIEVAPASDRGARALRVFLAADCLGVPPSFLGSGTTCVDAARREASPDTALEPVASVSEVRPRIGTWPIARELDCTGNSPPGATCIRGGFSVLGDASLAGLADGIVYRVDPAPPRPVRVSPFHMDVHEYTVGRFNELMRDRPGAFLGKPPWPRETTGSFANCTWLGESGDGSHDELPLNCTTHASAAELCALEGGSLPTEAQWEHAARGRGRHLRYPWGDATPSCCAASLGRFRDFTGLKECDETGVEPVGSHRDAASCAGLADESIDGVLDLAGSVREMTRDKLEAYSGPCWSGAGVLLDPLCESEVTLYALRGGSWGGSLGGAVLALRGTGLDAGPIAGDGFRCVYTDGGS